MDQRSGATTDLCNTIPDCYDRLKKTSASGGCSTEWKSPGADDAPAQSRVYKDITLLSI